MFAKKRTTRTLMLATRKKPRNADAANNISDNTVASGSAPIALPPALAKPKLNKIPRLIRQELTLDDPQKVAKAMEDLSDLLDASDKHSETNTIQAFDAGAHTMVLEQMERWQTNEEVQTYGCFCLDKLAYLDQNEPKVIDVGGVEAALAAMTLFPKSVGVQYAGLLALKNMITGDFEEASESTKKISSRFVTGNLKGIPLLKHALQEYQDDEEIQSVGLDIITFLSKKEEFQKVICDAGMDTRKKKHRAGKKCRGNTRPRK